MVPFPRRLPHRISRSREDARRLYRDRGDCENSFDELKNHWGWGGFTTHDLTRCRIMARIVALIFNWWFGTVSQVIRTGLGAAAGLAR
jgi:hypothetical protein